MSFNTLGLSEPLLRAVSEEGYSTPTPIQKKAIPVILEHRDILAGAQTGTGKTAGFTLPLLQLMSERDLTKGTGNRKVRALVVTPTRELAAQVGESVKVYGKYLPFKSAVIFGGVNINPQKKILKQGLDIVIATPGRLLDLAGQKAIDLSNVEYLILDEADRMLDMGFIHDIKKILALLSKKRQNMLFSATFSNEIKKLSDTLLDKPVLVEVARRNTASEQVKQSVYLVDRARKKELLSHLITMGDWQQVLVFTRTKHGANRLCTQLEKDGISASAIHGNKSQSARTKALAGFKNGSIRILVATDIAARGIDIDHLPHVVNFELPNVPEDYIHRIGRTGRADNEGEALSLVCIDEKMLLRNIEQLLKKDIPKVALEAFTPDPSIKAEPIQKKRTSQGRRKPNSSSSRNTKKNHGNESSENHGSRNNAPRNRNRSRSRNASKG